jgi:oxepin-CoA hydrolase/3-oxo-5,6-dehydrosuberyl-CoA semialdehyde dehydrogenase
MTSTAVDIRVLPSFVQGQWWQAKTGSPIRDASTGDVIAFSGSDGLDLEGAIDYARTVGQRALGELTFHQRALILKALGVALTAEKDHLYSVSDTTGATRRDSLVDIDGGIGVLFTYSSKGRRELPNTRTRIVDGEHENLSKDGSFGGQHVFERIPGVSFQINAFNFPVWGMLEKFAPAFLAGVPSIVKPASPTATLAEAAVRVMVNSGLLPDGALQLVCGAVRQTLDLLDVRDHVSFTGSADTAASLAVHPGVIRRGVGFTAEADSLNAAILGPDVRVDDPEFEAFVASVVAEMTTKAGQKCTSIRRIIVPELVADELVNAIAERITARTVLGDPRVEGTTMGPLASIEQREDVVRSVEALIAGGGRVVFGDAGAPEVRLADGNVSHAIDGAFISPILLRFDDADTDAVHEIEAFGPVASIVTYSSPDDAARLANRGGGSLVATVCSHDREFVARTISLIAPFHGRILVLDRDVARSSTGHGSPVPHLVHGGPGRAGGGEELGGIRAVKHFMRRIALQGSPETLSLLTEQWRSGATVFDGEHPFRKSIARLRTGDRIVSAEREVTLADIGHFAEFTGDTFYAHTDEEAAAANPFFPGRVAHGYLLLSWAAGLFVDPDPGPVLANYGLENLRFVTPVSPGDKVRVTLTAKQITPRENEEYGEVRWDAVLVNQSDETVATYDVLTLVAKQD